MKVFIAGTDTDVGKTLVSSWLCLHTRYPYFKPVQTGTSISFDRETVQELAGVQVYPESFAYPDPVSPHLAAERAGEEINLEKVVLPDAKKIIVEGAGGVLVPLNRKDFMIDLLTCFKLPVLLVARSAVGTINHTLLSLERLRQRNIPVLGVIMNGPLNPDNERDIAFYGKVKVLACMPYFEHVTSQVLHDYPLPSQLKNLLEGK